MVVRFYKNNLPIYTLQRVYIGFFILMVLNMMTGCAIKPATMPELSNVQEGDLILTTTGTPTSWLFIHINKIPEYAEYPNLSHVEIMLKDDLGHWQVAGIAGGKVRCDPVEKAFKGFRNLVIVSPNANRQAQTLFAQKAKQWLNNPTILEAGFSYTFEDIPGKTDAFYCVSFINEIHRQCGLPEPMPPYQPLRSKVWQHLNQLAHLPQNRTINAPVSLFSNPDHHIVLQWTNPNTHQAKMALNQALIQLTCQWYEQGWQLKQSNDANLLLKFSKYPKQVHAVAKLQISLKSFASDVHNCWYRLKRRGQLDEEMPSDTSPQIQDICQKYRTRYFEYVGQDQSLAHRQSLDTGL